MKMAWVLMKTMPAANVAGMNTLDNPPAISAPLLQGKPLVCCLHTAECGLRWLEDFWGGTGGLHNQLLQLWMKYTQPKRTCIWNKCQGREGEERGLAGDGAETLIV